MKKVTEEESKELFFRIEKADQANMLLSIIKSAASFHNSSFLIVADIINNLKLGIAFEVDSNIYYLIKRDLKDWEDKANKFPEDISVTINGFEKIEEAEEFCNWYSGQGESDASVWFDCRACEGKINSSSMLEQSTTKKNNTNIEMTLKMYK